MPQYDLKRATENDKDIVLHMRNQEFVRVNMVGSGIITPQDHDKWYTQMLNASDKRYFIFYLNKKPCGVVGFFNLGTDAPDWSFYLGYDDLPPGTGTELCRLGLEWYFDHHADKILTTTILEENVKSLKIHKKLGFVQSDSNNTVSLTYAAWNKSKTKI